MLSIIMLIYLLSYSNAVSNCECVQVDMEKLAGSLALHLTAMLISSDRNEKVFKYLLCGIRLLHSLCDLAPRHPKLEQVDNNYDHEYLSYFVSLHLL